MACVMQGWRGETTEDGPVGAGKRLWVGPERLSSLFQPGREDQHVVVSVKAAMGGTGLDRVARVVWLRKRKRSRRGTRIPVLF